ncbi:expressed unknown protein [Seminavis robusta]|uniref:Uncharacterized protein n=1 Tax=Seminavis robusta TaxID=568900 RepID=A0A9N8EBS2_9STRA|nr:expressed unknown protein [Seminavis robusta]|eukprot:Sro938_g222340.1 n/a (233) ;mRNA; f:30152-30850
MYNFNTTKATLFFLGLAAAVSSSAASSDECKGIQDCNTCVMNGCGWTGVTCFDSCSYVMSDRCYSHASFPLLQSQQICSIQAAKNRDWDLCRSQGSDCQSCTATSLSASPQDSCYWHPVLQDCTPGIVSGWSIGTDTCSTELSNSNADSITASSTASSSYSSSSAGTATSSSSTTISSVPTNIETSTSTSSTETETHNNIRGSTSSSATNSNSNNNNDKQKSPSWLKKVLLP